MVTKTKVIAVTGASRGIGAAIALELARRGFTVGCLTRKGKGPETQAGGSFTRLSSTSRATSPTRRASRPRLLNWPTRPARSTGWSTTPAYISTARATNWRPRLTKKVMATNATAVFAACREAYPHLVKSGGGTIVNIGSFFDKIGVKRNVAYCASKAAVGAITRCLAVEWANRGIRVLDVAPGYIVTDLNREAMTEGPLADYLKKRIPSGATGTTGDVAKLVAAIFSEDIPFLSGETIYIDGAQGININA